MGAPRSVTSQTPSGGVRPAGSSILTLVLIMIVKMLARAVLLIVCTALTVEARQAGTEHVPAADLVHLDVTVLGDDGQPIRGLAPTDFEVLQNGRPIPLAGFTPVDVPVAERPVGAQPVRGRLGPQHVAWDVLRNDDIVDRYVAIIIDDIQAGEGAGSGGGWAGTAGLDIARAIVDRLGLGDRAMVFFSFMGRQQGLTSDHTRLRSAIQRFAPRQPRPTDCQARDGASGCLIDTLRDVAGALPSLPVQRKLIVYISGGSPLPALQLPADNAATRELEPVQQIYRDLQRSHAVVYSVTPAGVGRLGDSADAVGLAEATGGRSLVDSMVDQQIDSMFRDIGAYYLLSIQPAVAQGLFEPVSVRVSRPDAQVSTRLGYFAAGEGDTAPPAATSPLEAALLAPYIESMLPTGASAAAFGQPDSRDAVVSVVTAVTGAAPGGEKIWEAEVAATAFDPQWRPRASHRQTIEVTAREGSGPLTVDVISGLELPPGRYELRVATESAGNAGSVFIDLDVPDFRSAPLSASGLVVSTIPVPYAASPLLADTLPVTPTTGRVFTRDDAAEVFLRFYQGGPDRARNLPVSVRVADVNGEGIIQGDEVVPAGQFSDSGATDWRFSLPLDRLTPGEYLLTVEATLDDLSEVRHLRFGVR